MKMPQRKRNSFIRGLKLSFWVALLVGCGYIYYLSTMPLDAPQQSVLPPVVAESVPEVGKEEFEALSEAPASIKIDKIGVSATIEAVGLTEDGLMDAPKTNEGVGWYDQSSRLGEDRFSVLLDGHYGTPAEPAVFYRLAELVVGDTIKLIGANGAILTYEVVETEQQYTADVDMEKALNLYPDTIQSLTIITCDGNYDESAATYDKRTIVYAKRTA